MLVVGLTGGIGAGKTTFASMLGERGAHVLNADELAREALRPGAPSWHSVVDQFGDDILVPGTMEIDRKRLGAIVFADAKKRAALNAIVHPVIFRRIADELERLRETSEVVVVDAALVVETGLHEAVNVVIVVTSRRNIRRDRLVRQRGMSFDEIQARMDAQATPEELIAKADIVVHNDGTPDDLAGEADRVWALLRGLQGS